MYLSVHSISFASVIYIFYIFKNKYWVSDLSLLLGRVLKKNNKDECFILGHF